MRIYQSVQNAYAIHVAHLENKNTKKTHPAGEGKKWARAGHP